MTRVNNEHKCVFVTGGAAGIGFATARRFAKAGYDVALLDADPSGVATAAESLQMDGVRALGLHGSVVDEAGVSNAFARTTEHFGGFSVLINNAGISSILPSLDLSVEDWRRAVDINLTGGFICAREAGRHFATHGGGSIVNIGSIYGTVAAPARAAYCATKSAMHMLTQVLAIEWADKGIRVNAVAPGYVRTNLVHELIAQGKLDAEALIRRTPMKRLAEAEEVAELVFAIATPNFPYMTGQIVGLDGGWTAYGYT